MLLEQHEDLREKHLRSRSRLWSVSTVYATEVETVVDAK